jgi:ATP-dependent DNA helicase RecQ
MIDREKPLEELQIDFDALERLKAGEYEKLNRVTRFALSGGCRQRDILHYFDERDAPNCGHCDNCGRRLPAEVEKHAVAHHAKVLEAVRIVLSGVARTEARFPCGKNLIAQMLCGSGSARMSKLGLNKLSTFGLLKHLAQPEVTTLIDGLIAAGCLKQVDIDSYRPVVQLTDFGSDVMKGKAELASELPVPLDLVCRLRGDSPGARAEASQETAETDEPPDADPQLLEALRQWRRERATAAGLPHYQILSNATLEELARRRPDSAEALLAIRGIGPAKLAQFGEALLTVLAEGTNRSGDDPSDEAEQVAEPPGLSRRESARGQAPRLATDADPDPAAVRPSHYWTWRLLSAGFSPEECAAIRGLEREAVLDHALRAAESGWAVHPEWCLAPELVAALEAMIGEDVPEQIRPLLARLPDGTRYEEVQLFLKCRRQAADD